MKNLVQHSKIKHIGVRHHFIQGHIETGDIILEFVHLHLN